MRTHEYAHTLTHKHIYVHMCSMYQRRDTFSSSSEDESIGVRKALSDERTSCFWGLREDARSEPGMTDSMLLINAGKAQEPTDS